jgi:hypothetical protein
LISYQIYKIIHLTGILMIFLALGGVATNAINGGSKYYPWRKPAAITHGVGLLLSLVGGFGLLARLGVSHGGLPAWVIAKLVIWGIFAGSVSLIYFKPKAAAKVWVLAIILGATAAYLAGQKPF